jgi:hypothetical protein
MKSIQIFVVFLAVLLMLIIAGCGKDKDTSTEPEVSVPPELVATWTYQSATVNGFPVSLALVLGWHQGMASARCTVNEDESFVYEELDSADVVQWTESGTFTVVGNNATITITSNDDGPVEPPEVLSGTWALSENELTLTVTMEEITVVLIATK